ncbi:MAG: hypothetical protein A2231_08250 [Candidatus Firestonebacteria bacterium RIFOXYA2_FULL_40_8]|nr:MAG: hypothetical protein A2231_08250 [Candidatus Firestonebacteria bacterium RIFOXYA2_FULL_40_8]
MIKKTGLVLLLVFVLLLSGERLFAQAAAPAIPEDQLKKLSSITGMSSSQINTYALSADQFMNVYAAAVISGNSFQVVYDNSDKGLAIPKYFKKYNVTLFTQTKVTEKFNKMKEQVGKGQAAAAAAADSYAGIDKRAVADVIARKTGISSGTIQNYGFGAGIPVGDILACCVIASKSGNSLSNVVEKRKQGGDMPSVYKSLAISAVKQTEIAGLINSYSEEVNAAGKSGGTGAAVTISEAMTADAKKIASAIGVSEQSILDAMGKGDSTADIIRAIAVSKKIGGSYMSVLEVKRAGGWVKVNTYYGVGNAQAQIDINKVITVINDKIKPPPPPIEKREQSLPGQP